MSLKHVCLWWSVLSYIHSMVASLYNGLGGLIFASGRRYILTFRTKPEPHTPQYVNSSMTGTTASWAEDSKGTVYMYNY